MELKMQKWGSSLVMGLFFIALVIGGCAKGDKASTSTTNPNPADFKPKGTVQGIVVDSVTQEPIVGALVSIGVKSDTTNAQGQYVIPNVPATYDAINQTWEDHYDITIDLRNVTSPVKMTAASTTPRYPNFSYDSVQVGFTSLNDTSCNDSADDEYGTDTCNNHSNHDTPVDGLVASLDIYVGKLDANISGKLYGGCDDTTNPDYYVAKAGYTVNLISTDSYNSSTGFSGHLVGTTMTDANGVFTFNNVEAQQSFNVQAMVSPTDPTIGGVYSYVDDSTYYYYEYSYNGAPVQTPGDGQTNTKFLEPSNALHACLSDTHGPAIIAFTPEQDSDLAPNATETVTFTFNEPIVQTPYASVDPSGPSSLHDNIYVAYDGSKGGNIPYTLSWNGTFDQLTVTFATGSSSYYYVYLDVDNLEDAAGRTADAGSCDTGTECTVYFTTNGGLATGTTTALTVVNALQLNVGASTAVFDWPIISGAKSYNLYCQADQVYQDGTSQPGTMLYYKNVSASETTQGFTFVGSGNEHSLQFQCMVRAQNSDYTEGADSNVVTVKDGVGPDFTANGTNGSPTVTVSFTEPVREADAETLANYGSLTGTDAALTLQSVTYDTATWVATLTYSANITDDTGDTLTITGVKDLAGNTNLTTPAGNNQDTL